MRLFFAKRRNTLIVIVALMALALATFVLIRYRDLVLSTLHINLARPDSAAALHLRMVADVPLAGGASRFDYQVVDESHSRLFIAHLGADLVTVFDLKNQRVITDVVGVAGAHGVTVAPDLGLVFAAATGTHQVAVIDAETLQIIARIDSGDYPDGLAYDPETHKLFVSDESGRADIVMDTQTNQRLNRIDLGSDV